MAQDARYAGTRLILPAPRETRSTSQIAWYEVEIIPGERLGRLIAYDLSRSELGVAEVSAGATNDSRLRITGQGAQVTVSVSISRISAGELELRGRINDDPFIISGGAPASSVANVDDTQIRREGEIHLDAAQSALVSQWSLLADPLVALGEAIAGSGMDGSWGCSSCVVLLAGMEVGVFACFGGALAACAADLYAGATFIENCEGACA
jgi:hypothetical protein